MRRLLVLASLVALATPAIASAQTYGQQYYRPPVTTYGQIYGHAGAYTPPGAAYGYGGQSYGGQIGNPYSYRPPQYGYGYDRGGRYGYSANRSNQWTRWSSPPGRGYHDVYGYNDDRAPRGADYSRSRGQNDYCCVGAYLYDR